MKKSAFFARHGKEKVSAAESDLRDEKVRFALEQNG